MAGSSDQTGCGGEDRLEALDSAQGDQGGAAREVLGAAAEDLHIAQLQGTHYLVEEGRFLVLRLDEDEMQRRGVDLQEKAGEAGAGAEIDNPTLSGQTRAGPGRATQKPAGGEEGLAEMSCNDTFGATHGGQVDAGVPAQQQLQVAGQLRQLPSGEAGGKGLEQGSDADGIHRERVQSAEDRVQSEYRAQNGGGVPGER